MSACRGGGGHPGAGPPAALVWCFGAGTGGQLGRGGTADALTPQALLLRARDPSEPATEAPRVSDGRASGDADVSSTLHLAAGGNHVVAWWRGTPQPQAGVTGGVSARTPRAVLHGSCTDATSSATGGALTKTDTTRSGDDGGQGAWGRTGPDGDSGVQGSTPAPEAAADVLTWGHDVAGAGTGTGAAAAAQFSPASAPVPAADTREPRPSAPSMTGPILTATPEPAACGAEAQEVVDEVTGCRLLLTPRAVALPRGGCGGGSRVRQVACGWEHTVYLTEDGSVWVAGRGSRGQLGLGPGPGGAAAAQPQPLSGALAAALPTGWAVTCVAAGMWHTLFAATGPGAPGPPREPQRGRRSHHASSPIEASDRAAGVMAAAPVAAVGALAGAGSGPWAGQWADAAAVILGCGSNRRQQLGACGQPDWEPRTGAVSGQASAAGGASATAPPLAEDRKPRLARGASSNSGRAGGGGGSCAKPPAVAAAWTPVLVHLIPGSSSGAAAPTAPATAGVLVAAGGDRSAYLDARIGCLFVWGRGLPPEVHDSGQPREVPLLRGTGAADAAGGDSKAAAAATTSAAAAASAQPSEGPCTVKAVAWRQVALGWQHVLAVDTCGRVWAWGSNRNGQLARPLPEAAAMPPLQSPATATATATGVAATTGLQAQQRSSLQPQAVTGTGADVLRHAEAAGDGGGVEMVAASAAPLQVALPAAAACVAAGSEHCAAVLLDGRIFTWGWGEHGMLGVGDTHSRWQPQGVAFGGESVGQCRVVACGAGFTVCA